MSDQNAQNLRAQIEARGALEEMRLLRQEAERHGDTVVRDVKAAGR